MFVILALAGLAIAAYNLRVVLNLGGSLDKAVQRRMSNVTHLHRRHGDLATASQPREDDAARFVRAMTWLQLAGGVFLAAAGTVLYATA
ncbi:hypothetical protein [Yinghuangia soli]|uniref:Uncharacterized protein n=1 Tax=Yinghuangia soli TaxID=2908204 RepID=A0AA41U404_9ACTN|nr:hypothetical protein [Yinghuangia soli]MCF2533278.1 hypothetical protein [Yinghuangia soli]